MSGWRSKVPINQTAQGFQIKYRKPHGDAEDFSTKPAGPGLALSAKRVATFAVKNKARLTVIPVGIFLFRRQKVA